MVCVLQQTLTGRPGEKNSASLSPYRTAGEDDAVEDGAAEEDEIDIQNEEAEQDA